MEVSEYEKIQARGRRKIWPLIFLLILIGFGAAMMLKPNTVEMPKVTSARLFVTKDSVELRPADSGEWISVDGSIEVLTGSSIRTNESGLAEVMFDDGSVMRLNNSTEIILTSLPSTTTSTVTELLIGETWNRIVNLGQGKTYEVETANAIALVRGSAFSMKQKNKLLGVYSVQHEVKVSLKTGTASTIVPETRMLSINPNDPLLISGKTCF